MSAVSGLVELVRLQVLRGELAPGERVIEVLLADRFGATRTALREALRRLEGEGLMVADEEGGMCVVRVDAVGLAATLELRAALEELSCRRAAARVKSGRAPRTALRDLRALARVADDEPTVFADRNFHRAVDALAGEPVCRDALNRAWDRILLAAADGVPVPGHAAGSSTHAALVTAIAAGDADEAAALARMHAARP